MNAHLGFGPVTPTLEPGSEADHAAAEAIDAVRDAVTAARRAHRAAQTAATALFEAADLLPETFRRLLDHHTTTARHLAESADVCATSLNRAPLDIVMAATHAIVRQEPRP